MSSHLKASRRILGGNRARRSCQIGASVVGTAAAAVLAFGSSAGAVDAPSANSRIVASGSQAAYSTVDQLESLFNQSLGCPTFVPFPSSATPQNLDFSCTSPPTVGANPENPYNDDATEEPPLGSSNGILQLEDSGVHGATATDDGTPIKVYQGVNFATSTRGVSTSDLQGLNFVAYARDGVSWFHYTQVSSHNTPSKAVTSLTQAQLEGIYNGTIDNWKQVGGISAPIVVFTAPEGAGVQSVWKSFLGYDPVTVTSDNCANPSASPPSGCVGPGVVLQNEDKQIGPAAFTKNQQTYLNSNLWGGKRATEAQIEEDAIFFFSYGNYAESCTASGGKACGGSVLPAGTSERSGGGQRCRSQPEEHPREHVPGRQLPVQRVLERVELEDPGVEPGDTQLCE